MSPDFKPNIAAVMGAKPQGLLTALYSGDLITMAKQAPPYGLFKQVEIVVTVAQELELETVLGHDFPFEDVLGMHSYVENWPKYRLGKPFYDRMVKKYGPPYIAGSNYWGSFSGQGYCCLLTLKAAIEKAGSTKTEDLIEALESGLYIDLPFQEKAYLRPEDHQLMKDIVILLVKPVDENPGWKVVEHTIIPAEKVYSPPTPGQKLDYETALRYQDKMLKK
jgi:ABC-type branched-subunit amino acid transport system substrate-binding protein